MIMIRLLLLGVLLVGCTDGNIGDKALCEWGFNEHPATIVGVDIHDYIVLWTEPSPSGEKLNSRPWNRCKILKDYKYD